MAQVPAVFPNTTFFDIVQISDDATVQVTNMAPTVVVVGNTREFVPFIFAVSTVRL